LISPAYTPQSHVFVSAARMLSVHALRQQYEGKHEEALAILLDTLTVARHLQNRALLREAAQGLQVEIVVCRAIALWSQHAELPTELLQRAMEAVRVHDRLRPSTADCVRSEYVLARSRMDHPQVVLSEMNFFGRDREDLQEIRWRDWLLTSSVVIPWEKIRRERLLNGSFELLLEAQEMDYPTLSSRAKEASKHEGIINPRESPPVYLMPPGADSTRDVHRVRIAMLIRDDSLLQNIMPYYITGFEGIRFQAAAYVRALSIQIGLALYQHQHGEPAEKLEQLVPTILSSIPIDPYTQRPFRYRRSTGEHLQWRTRSKLEEESGQWELEPFGALGMPGAAGPGDGGGEGVIEPPPPGEPAPPRMAGTSTRRKIAAGAGLLWSADADGVDDGGWSQSQQPGQTYMHAQPTGRDLIFVIPRIERKKK